MGVVLDCQTKDGNRIFVKNVPSFLGRFAHEIGCLMRIPESARCVIKEYDPETQCVVMETIDPGDKAHFFDNVEGYQKLFDFLAAEKTEIDDEIEHDYDYFTEVLRSDYDKYFFSSPKLLHPARNFSQYSSASSWPSSEIAPCFTKSRYLS